MRRRKYDKLGKIRQGIIIGCLVASFLDTLIQIIVYRNSLLTELLRPVIVCLLFQGLRTNFWMIALNCKDSIITLTAIFLVVLYFAYFATLIFYTTFEGLTTTPNLFDSYFEFLVLLTTENYPFVFLNSFESSWYSVLYFWIFIVICIFLLQSVLLALVFENYKRRIEELGQEKMDRRLHYIEMFYD